LASWLGMVPRLRLMESMVARIACTSAAVRE
jgi:hypothetical protein